MLVLRSTLAYHIHTHLNIEICVATQLFVDAEFSSQFLHPPDQGNRKKTSTKWGN